MDEKDLFAKEKLRCMFPTEERPDSSSFNDNDPFAPYFYCPTTMGIREAYSDATHLLEDLYVPDIIEIKTQIAEALDKAEEAQKKYYKEVLKRFSEEEIAYLARQDKLNRADILLQDFPPESQYLSTGRTYHLGHLWAVYAVQAIAEALAYINLPPFYPEGVDAPQRAFQGELGRINYLIQKNRSNMEKAGQKLTNAHGRLLRAFAHNVGSLHRKIESEKIQKRMSGLYEINQLKNTAIRKASEIAEERWSADTEKKIRIGEMADIVYRDLVSNGLQAALPDRPESIKSWIKSVAPDYAKLGGRSKKPRRP